MTARENMISGVNHITLAVSNLDIAFAFYTEILHLKPIAMIKNKSAYLLAGEDWIALVQDKNPDSLPSKSYAHLAFSVNASDFQILSKSIKDSGAKIWQDSSSPEDSLYFTDPSGNRLEIHTGDWRGRLSWLQANPNTEAVIFE